MNYGNSLVGKTEGSRGRMREEESEVEQSSTEASPH